MTFVEKLLSVESSKLNFDAVERLVEQHPEEGLHLEFKSGSYFDVNHKIALTKTVSSFANSDGGLLIIGVREGKKQNGISYAETIDGVSRDAAHSKETLENLLIDGISPMVEGMEICKLDYGDRSIFLIDIPQGSRPPYMASDNKYYKRLNFRIHAMEHYEIEDLFGRRMSPMVSAKFDFTNFRVASGKFTATMEILFKNYGRVAAKHLILFLTAAETELVKQDQGFYVNRIKGTKNFTLQYGPYVGTTPVIIHPSPQPPNQFYSTAGKVLVKTTTGYFDIHYRITHEVLPTVTGGFRLNVGPLIASGAKQKVSIEAPDESALR